MKKNHKNRIRLYIIIGVFLINVVKLIVIYNINGNIDFYIFSSIGSYLLIVSGIIGIMDKTDYIPRRRNNFFKRNKNEVYYGNKSGTIQDLYIIQNVLFIVIGIIVFFVWI